MYQRFPNVSIGIYRVQSSLLFCSTVCILCWKPEWTGSWQLAVSVYSVNITSLVSGTQCYIVLTDLKLPQFLLDVECACIKVILFHRTFSKEQYFDSNGLFFSTVYSTPVLFNCLLLLVSTQIFPMALSRKKLFKIQHHFFSYIKSIQ